MSELTPIAVYVATYRRNDPLRLMLESVLVAAERVADRAEVAMIVVDDNPGGDAEPVIAEFEGRFPLGIHYRHVGKGNISLVRNVGLDLGIELGEWVAMTDDDNEVSPEWLEAMLDVQAATDADAVTGPSILRVPPGSPAWIHDQPFLGEGLMEFEDGAELEVAATNNSMVRSAWFADHPEVRFDPALGVLGGEDMVLYRTAHQHGLRIHFAAKAVVFGNEPADRATFRYRLRINYWLGNTMCVTNLALGSASRPRLALRSLKMMASAAVRPFGRIAKRERPQWRFAAALAAQSIGMALGVIGVRRAHH